MLWSYIAQLWFQLAFLLIKAPLIAIVGGITIDVTQSHNDPRYNEYSSLYIAQRFFALL